MQASALPEPEARRGPAAASVINRSLESAARTRWAVPVTLALAGLGMVVNEATYQHTTSTLRGGIALTDARLEAQRTLLGMTQLEVAARTWQATRHPSDQQRFEEAAAELARQKDRALSLVAEVDTQRTIGLDRLRSLIDDQSQRLREWVQGRGAVGPDGALGRERAGELAGEFDDVLAKAAQIQQQARVSLYDAFLLSRGAVHALIVLSVLALVLFVRQLRRRDAEKAQEHERLEGQIRERTAALRSLARHLVDAREDERGRVARELHDEMGGLLTAMKLELARLKRVPQLPAAAIERVASFDRRVNDGIALKRRIVENLRPSSLDQLGLTTALQMLCADTAAVAGLPVHVELQPVALGKEAELSVFRVVQESLTNALKYAQARAIWVRLEATPTHAQLTVRDDGVGFDPAARAGGGHGQLGMRLRIESHGGTLQVHSTAGGGACITAQLPLAT